MKIALCFPGCHRRGGVERIVWESAQFLLARGHEVSIFANQFEPSELPGARFVPVPMRARPSFLTRASFFSACTRKLQGEPYDVLATHGCISPGGGVLWVQSVQAAWLEQASRWRSPFSTARLKQRLNPLHRILLHLEAHHYRGRNYRQLITTTPTVRADLNRIYGVPAADVEIIPNGFSPAEFSPQLRQRRREAARAELGLKTEEIALLFVGNELERKGLPTILAALSKLRDPRFRLLVVGKPPRGVVQQMAHRCGVSDQIIACGPTSDVARFHAAADAFVLPTQYEAFCLAILEALGSGLPVVTSRVPGAIDAIIEGENGLLISDPRSGDELATKLSELLDDARRAELAARAAPSVAAFAWPQVLERYEAVLERNRR